MNWIKKTLYIVVLTILCITVPALDQEARAIIPIAKIIKEAIKKVIKAFDLMIQRLQNKTIALQNAQRVLENALSKLKLKEIAEWTDKHRELYKQYYDELWKVKTLLSAYQRIREIVERQARIITEYQRAWNLVRQDDHFTEAEIDYMYRVYRGILQESMRNMDQLNVVINSFNTQMTDAQRLAIIVAAGERVEQNLLDLVEFNMNAYTISINRSRSQYEIDRVKKLYGID